MWIWQQPAWPNFEWSHECINPLLCEVHFNQGKLLGQMGHANAQVTLDTLLANIVHSSAIEGEKLNASSVRSSLANKLGVQETKPYPTSKQTEGLAEMMVDAIDNWDQRLTLERILYWHLLLFPVEQTALNPIAGGTLRGDMPMQVVSGRLDRPTVHFEAPPRAELESELAQFIDWFNESRLDTLLNPLVRAAIAHLWFVTIHPLDDGNGRITRLLTDLALAQAENQSIRLYAMSVSILGKRKSYYNLLENSQKGTLDITPWLHWFLETLNQTLLYTLKDIEQTVAKTQFWQRVDQTALTQEQVKVLNRLLDGDFSEGISSSQYQKVAKVSRATATRHLVYLVEQGCLCKSEAGGRSQRYKIALA
ncbi:Fic family protein [Parashewanella spongiae]|uniref:Fic family protein n=1 Tax=Parashewanella spongiae TaxID=342950 RepID=A0A3A6U0A0_9GAMM|nr:Fic family protein [Parashewanella spongiae]MCL1077054.1 Fic family protein [Parashewanella spongiae]RJY18732.1 Fic family protein [Parashewanella spongiae]